MMRVQLIVVQGKPEGKTIPLAGPVFRIGRDPNCHLRPSSDQVSRQHAEITITNEAVVLKDLGSRNGTILNGRTLTAPATLKSGDLIKIGHLTFAVSIQGAPVAAQPATPRPISTPTPSSLDEVPQETVEAWLIADNERPIPDRPSGVYDGDTITIDAYKENRTGAKPPSSREMPTAPPPPPAAPAARAEPSVEPKAEPVTEPKAEPVADAPAYLQNLEFDRLPEGEAGAQPEPRNQASEPEEDAEEDAEESAPAEDEFIDESNPFHAARKQTTAGASSQPDKASYKDSSDAARDILNRMLERRRSR